MTAILANGYRSYDRAMTADIPDLDCESAEARASDLVTPGAEYDPMDMANFDEALSETLGAAGETLTNTLRKLAMTGNGEGLVIVLRDMSKTYWTNYARRELGL